MYRRQLLIAVVAGVPGLGPPSFPGTRPPAAADPIQALDPDPDEAPFVPAPEGALVLFDGTGLSGWMRVTDGGPAGWKVVDGTMEVVHGSGDIRTRETFADYQLHVEFWLPPLRRAEERDPSICEVCSPGCLEVRALDTRGLPLAEGEAGGYQRSASPIRSTSGRQGQWQAYDIAYRAPRCGADGEQTECGRMTVFHNRVLIHNSLECAAPAAAAGRRGEERRPSAIILQDRGERVRYRNIWVLPLEA